MIKDNTELRLIPIKSMFEYYASNTGHILRKLKGRPRMKRTTTGYYFDKNNWYIYMKASFSGKNKNYLRIEIEKVAYQVHRLVLQCFEPTQKLKEFQVNHKDMNTCNNNLNNLEWVTNKQNSKHKAENIKNKITYQEMRQFYLDSLNNLQYYKYKPKQNHEWLIKHDTVNIQHYLKENKLSQSRIAKLLNVPSFTVQYWATRLNIKTKTHTNIDHSKVIELKNQGMSSKEVAKICNCRNTTVDAIYRNSKVQRLSKPPEQW